VILVRYDRPIVEQQARYPDLVGIRLGTYSGGFA
jgi:hypothetical protein